MGKSLLSTTTTTTTTKNLQELAKIISSSQRLQRVPKHRKPIYRNPESVRTSGVRVHSEQERLKMEGEQDRLPLSHVVSDCVRRWFEDTLKEAKAGDCAMQVLVGQMYCSGYGVPRDAQKGRAWIIRASKSRSSVWKVSDKHPGYNASDSDSDELRGDTE